MTLAPVAGSPGLWRNDALAESSRGVHALIVGISAYPHLDGGDGPRAPATAGLGQLVVSAATAADLFAWLRAEGAFGGAPMASCRLLLSPAEAESKRVQAATDGWYAMPDFTALSEALRGWADEIYMAGVAPGEAQRVALFFFSGHGLEHVARPALLARDVLRPAATGPTNAVDFNSLWTTVRGLGLDAALFFVDACRDQSQALYGLGVRGQCVLTPATVPRPAPRTVAWLQASETGRFAYQTSANDRTFFGEALIQALDDLPADAPPYDRTSDPWRLLFGGLERHMKRRVPELLAKSSTETQNVESGGYPYNPDAIIALRPPKPEALSGPQPAGAVEDVAPGPLPARAAPRAKHRRKSTSLGGGPAALTTGLPSVAELAAAAASTLSVGLPILLEHQSAARLDHFRRRGVKLIRRRAASLGDAGRVLGAPSESALPSIMAFDLDTGEEIEAAGVLLRGARRTVKRNSPDARSFTAWLDFDLPPGEGRGWWLKAGHPGEAAWAVALPTDAHHATPVRLDLGLDLTDPRRWRLTGLAARLADPATSEADESVWTPVWDSQRIELLVDLGQAAESLSARLDAFLALSPPATALAIAAAYLIRAGRRDAADAALSAFDEDAASVASDIAFLRAESLRRSADDRLGAGPDALPAVLDAHMDGARRGTPLLGQVLEMAAQQSAWLAERLRDSGGDIHGADRFAFVRRDFEEVFARARRGSLFSAFAGDGLVRENIYEPRMLTAFA